MKKTILLSGVVIVIALVFSSCAKDGATGPAGKDGNANVIGSNTVTLNGWTSDFDDGTTFEYSKGVNWSAITQEIKDKGVVMVYMQSGTDWYALPFSMAGTTYSDAYNYYVNVGKVKIVYTGYDNSGSPGTASQDGLIVRIVAISATGRIANPQVDYKNYNMVKEAFNLKD